MSARMKRQIGFCLLGAVTLFVGLGVAGADEDGYGLGAMLGNGMALVGGVLLVVFGLGLIADLIRSED